LSATNGPSGDAPGSPLGRRFLIGAFYIGFGSWGGTALRFAANLGIARLLGPQILGFFAFIFAVSELLTMALAFSIPLGLIQAPRSSQRHEDTALVITGALGLIGVVGAAALAPFLYVHRSPEAALIIVLLGLGRLVGFLGAIPLAKLEREVRYGAVAGINTSAGVIPVLSALLLAWLGAGVWALVAGNLLTAFMLFGLSFPISGYRYRRGFDRRIASELMAFGRPMWASRALEIALERIDRLLIGGFMGDLRLGLYHQARVLGETGVVVGNPIYRLVFNLYARVREDPPRLSRAFGLVNYFLVRLIFAGAATLIVFPEPTIRLLLGEGWLEASPLLRVFGLHAALLPVFENAKQLLYARGQARKVVMLRLMQLPLLLLGVAAAIAADRVVIVAASMSGVTVFGMVVGFFLGRDVALGALRESLLAPSMAIALTSFALCAPPLLERLAELPYFVLPFLPPLLYAGLLLVFERTRLFRKLRTVYDMLRASSADAGTSA
jgi:PST family polysaccharide transporter